MIQSAIDNEKKLRASSVEFKLPKPSYTIDTLAYLKEKYPTHKFSLIMGSDGYQNIEKWKNFQVILDNYRIFIYKRPGFDVNPLSISTEIRIVDAPMLDISSTRIRDMIKEKRSVRYLVPDVVLDEIESNGYYRG